MLLKGVIRHGGQATTMMTMAASLFRAAKICSLF